MVARSKSKPSTCAEGSMKVLRSSSYIFSNSPSSQQQCPSLQVQKNQRVLQELLPSSFSIQRTSLSIHLMNLALLSIVLLLIQSPSVVQSKSIALVSQQQQQQQDDTHRAQDSGLQLTEEEESVHERRKRDVQDPTLWPNNTIPFIFQEPFPRRYKTQVMNAMGVWQKRTCIKFVDRTDEEYFARISISNFVCRSLVGLRNASEDRNVGQPVHLTISCLRKRGLVMHELGHLIGFFHEHQRPDRDDYIKVFPANVPERARGEFQKLEFTTYGKYDFDSIMHYSLTAFSHPNTPAMAVREGVTVPEGVVIGERHSLSRADRKRTDKMYNCQKNKNVTETTPTTPTVSSDNIYTGEQVNLQINGTNFTGSEWLSCTEDGCVVGTCPGKYFRTGDLTACSSYVFTLYKVIPGNDTSSKVVRVGDHIVLEYLPKSMIPDKTGHIAGNKRRLFVSCNPTTQVCALSSTCVTEANRYNDSYCRENVLIVRAEGKKVGDPITHRDLIGFEFEAPHNPLFEEQCAFGCNAKTKICSKKRCINFNSNSLSPNSLTGSSPEDHPQCGKDMFYIKKF